MTLIIYKSIIFITRKIYFEEFSSSNWKVCLEANFHDLSDNYMFLTFRKQESGKKQSDI